MFVCSSPKSGNAKCDGLMETCDPVFVVPSASGIVKTSPVWVSGCASEQNLQTQSHAFTHGTIVSQYQRFMAIHMVGHELATSHPIHR